MASRIGRVVFKLRKPEYTGENRCFPCTILNIFIASIVAVGVGVFSPTFAVLVFAIFLVTIYFRGYLIPGTPRLTAKYLPDRILAYFDTHTTQAETGEPNQEFDVEAALVDANAVTDCAHNNDLCLTDAFQTAWRANIKSLRTTDTTRRNLADLLSVDPDNLEFKDRGKAFIASVDGRRIGQWESQAAFIADMAATTILQETYPAWPHLNLTQQSQMLGGLRIFLENCPSCDGSVSLDQEQVESCCRSIEVIAATCDDCGVRLFESDHTPLTVA